MRTAEYNLDVSRGQIRRDVVEQVDGQLDSAIRELQQQSEQECKLFKLELNAAFEDKVRGDRECRRWLCFAVRLLVASRCCSVMR